MGFPEAFGYRFFLVRLLPVVRLRFGDMRVEVVKQIIVMWETLKDKKGNFIPNFIGSFLSLTLIKNKGEGA